MSKYTEREMNLIRVICIDCVHSEVCGFRTRYEQMCDELRSTLNRSDHPFKPVLYCDFYKEDELKIGD